MTDDWKLETGWFVPAKEWVDLGIYDVRLAYCLIGL